MKMDLLKDDPEVYAASTEMAQAGILRNSGRSDLYIYCSNEDDTVARLEKDILQKLSLYMKHWMTIKYILLTTVL